MKQNYNLSHRLIAYILFIGLFLQSCGGFQNHIVPQEKKQPNRTIELSDNPLVNTDKEIVTSDSYLASFYEEGGELKADVEVNAPEGFNKAYTSLPVHIAQDIDVAQLEHLNKEEQNEIIHASPSQNGQPSSIAIFKRDLLEGMQNSTNKPTEKQLDLPDTPEDFGKEKSFNPHQRTIQVNSLTATFTGFIARILIERNFFQNAQVPAELLLYMANDLIKTLTPQKKETLNVSKEISLLWKQVRGYSLTEEEQCYLDDPKEIDVTAEILNGLKYSSIALLGQSFYTSVTSPFAKGLSDQLLIWGSFAGSVITPLALPYAVAEVLQRAGLTETQRSFVEPWLNMVGRLAIGFVPKVHATERGIHYHYPSLEGHYRTVSGQQNTTVHGDNLTVEVTGPWNSPEGIHEAAYEGHFQTRAFR